jgi:hypothetical protein
MTTATPTTGSAFPPSVDELVPRVRARQVELGKPLSRNQVMREFRVGADKARAVLDALTGTEMDPATRPEVSPGRLLHAVTPTGDTSDQARHDASGHGPDGAQSAESVTTTADPAGNHAVLVTPFTDPGTKIPAGDASPQGRSVTDADGSPAGLASSSSDTTPAGGSVTAPVRSRVRSWRLTLVLLALPAFVAIWGGWVGLGGLTGWGPMPLLPGIADGFVLNSAITLPIGVEAYAAFALRVWLSGFVPVRARRFAKVSAIGALVLGAAGQVAYHLMSAAGITKAPWPVTTLVSCLPVVVLGCAAGLAHLIREFEQGEEGSR